MSSHPALFIRQTRNRSFTQTLFVVTQSIPVTCKPLIVWVLTAVDQTFVLREPAIDVGSRPSMWG